MTYNGQNITYKHYRRIERWEFIKEFLGFGFVFFGILFLLSIIA